MKILTLLTIAILVCSGCKKDDFIDINKEIMISLTGGTGLGGGPEPWTFTVDLPYFDISNYSNIKSAIMAVNDLKTYTDASDAIGEGNFELVDLTNNQVIENSIVTSDDIATDTYKASANFFNNIPKGKIKLGIKVYSNGDFTTDCRSIYLILSR
jgi:hypothetical protein